MKVWQRLLLSLATASLALGVTVAVAGGSKTGASNRVRTEDNLRALDAAAADELKAPMEKAALLLERGRAFREAGDVPHAEAMDRAARAWSEYAATLAEVLAVENGDAGPKGRAPTSAEKKVALDEAISQNARLRTELDRLETELRNRDAGAKPTKGTKPVQINPPRSASSTEVP